MQRPGAEAGHPSGLSKCLGGDSGNVTQCEEVRLLLLNEVVDLLLGFPDE